LVSDILLVPVELVGYLVAVVLVHVLILGVEKRRMEVIK